jgi:transposase
MKLHGNAKLSPKGRPLLCRRVLEQGWSLAQAAEAAGVSERTAGVWVRRYPLEGELGLLDRSSAPHRVPGRTHEALVEVIASLRRLRMTGAEIAECLGMALSTVSGIPDPHRAGQVLPAGATRAAEPPCAQAVGRADPHRCQEARTDRSPRRGAPRDRRPWRRAALPRRRLGIRACVRR